MKTNPPGEVKRALRKICSDSAANGISLPRPFAPSWFDEQGRGNPLHLEKVLYMEQIPRLTPTAAIGDNHEPINP